MSKDCLNGCLTCQEWIGLKGDLIWGECKSEMYKETIKINGKNPKKILTYRHNCCPYRKRKKGNLKNVFR